MVPIETSFQIHKPGKMKNKLILPLVLIAIIILATACFAGGNPTEGIADEFGSTAGFLRGLWHGFIAPFDFIGMLFSDEITMYAQNNNGGLYALGFLLGSGGWGFFGSKGASRVSKSRVNIQSERFDNAEIIE